MATLSIQGSTDHKDVFDPEAAIAQDYMSVAEKK
jgi:hypothetical protein